MSEAEIRKALQETMSEPQLFPLESTNGNRIVFAFVVRFPHSSGRMLRIVEEIPSVRHVIDPKRCFHYAARIREELVKNRINGDLNAVQWTNWISMAASIQRLIMDFNNSQAKRAQQEDPVREAVAAAHARKH